MEGQEAPHPHPHRAVLNKGSEEEILLTGFRRSWIRTGLSVILTVLLGGLPYLVARWKPSWRLTFTCRQCRLKEATRLVESRE